jgi:ParB family chromosome partitioning protein
MRIPIEQIHAVKNPRKLFQGIDELAQSIDALGQLTPLIVRQVTSERYDLIAGERRWRALQQLQAIDPAKWSHAECTVIPPSVTLTDELQMQLAENVARREMRIWEVGAAILELQKLGQPLALIAPRIGMSVSAARRAAAIAAGLAPEVIASLSHLPFDAIPPTKLLQLARVRDSLGLPDAERQMEWLKRPPGKPPRGTYDRALERRLAVAKLAALEVDLLPTLHKQERRVAEAIIAYMRRGGKVKPFKWEDFDR